GREHLDFLAERGVADPVTVPDGESIRLGGTTVHPFRLAEDYVYAFVLEEDGRRALVAMDELNGWTPPSDLGHFDVAVLPVGVFEHDPRTGERKIAEEHPVLGAEATYEETLAMIDALDADRVYLTHVEEMNGLSHDYLRELEPGLAAQGRPVTFAYDTLVVEV
ncbi:MAG: phosphoribosyl 1,2-cyclic phosphate phosphodiesterase, partial [Gaiellaceae bacterium]|nr:phosphoribosyl 1,2-cyclic phosphate phosphodiesterase [Gaiellaceae bacterium]